MHTGEAKTRGGRAGEGASTGLSASLRDLGLRARPVQDRHALPGSRAAAIDWDACEPQPGDADPRPFSFLTDRIDGADARSTAT